MATPSTTRALSTGDVLAGLTRELSGPLLQERLAAFCGDLDAIGHVDAGGEPSIDESALRAMLRRIVSKRKADAVVAELRRHPDHCLAAGGAPAPWFEFAERVRIYDSDGSAAFAELGLADDAPRWALVDAVHDRFPSLEKELIDPEVVPPAIERFLALTPHGEAVRTELGDYLRRQLGWWAVAAFALLVPGAMYQQRRAHGYDPTAGMTHPWPVFTFVSAATIGGWTLTVVESCLLATDSAGRR